MPKFTSAYHEYTAGYWRWQKNRVYVTLETVIPPMPTPLLESPDEATYHKAQADIDEKVDALNLKIVSVHCMLKRLFLERAW